MEVLNKFPYICTVILKNTKNIQTMRLSPAAILSIKGFSTEDKNRLAAALEIGIKTLYRYLDSNDPNLTKAAALVVIREVTGLPDSEILKDMGTVVGEKA